MDFECSVRDTADSLPPKELGRRIREYIQLELEREKHDLTERGVYHIIGPAVRDERTTQVRLEREDLGFYSGQFGAVLALAVSLPLFYFGSPEKTDPTKVGQIVKLSPLELPDVQIIP